MADTMHQKTLGKRGEDAAAAFFTRKGCRIVERNYRCRDGEIDLVIRDGEFLVFVEVKTRSSTAYGYGRDAITKRKQEKIILVAQHYLMERYPDELPPCRFDLAEVEIYRGEVVSVEHYQAAFMGDGG